MLAVNHRFLILAFLPLTLSVLASCNQKSADEPVVAEKELRKPGSVGMQPDDRGTDSREHRFARMALDCVNKQFPNKISHVLNSAEDVQAPQRLYPAFYGCYDWHSSVHGHWLLARLWGIEQVPELDGEIAAALARSFTKENIAAERLYFMGEDRDSFERPYGMAWFLQLMAELRQIEAKGGDKGAQAAKFVETLAPLEAIIVEKLKSWLPKLAYPIRLGTHNQTAFAFGLIIDWADQGGDAGLGKMVRDKASEFHAKDAACPLAYEPSGEDFLSPCLHEADLMRRVLPEEEFGEWLTRFLPQIPAKGSGDWLAVGIVRDPSDGKLVHLDGLNLARAWALEGIAAGLPQDDERIPALRAASVTHGEAGVKAVSSEFYAGSHWLASFATYLVTKRGIPEKVANETNVE